MMELETLPVDPLVFSDGHHFDNPVYSTFRASSPTSPSSEPLNNTRIINRLGPKITNTEREKAAAASYLSEDEQSDCVSEKGKKIYFVHVLIKFA